VAGSAARGDGKAERGTPLLLLGFLFCLLYLVADSAIEAYLLHMGGLWERLGFWDGPQTYERGVACLLILGLAGAGKGLLAFRRAAGERLRESEEKYEKAFRTSRDAITITRVSDGVLLEVNEGFTRLTGYTAEESIGATTAQLGLYVHPEDRDRVRSRLLEGGDVEEMEVLFRRKDGATFLALVSGTLLVLGSERCLLGTTRDITERKRVEEEIASVARFPAENPYPVIRIAEDGTLLYANASSRPLLEAWGGSVGDPAPDFLREPAVEAYREGAGTTIEVAAGGRVYSFGVAPVPGSGYTNLYGRDISEQKRAERALRESEARARGLFQAVAGGVVMQDREGRIVDANPAACEILGVTLEQMKGLTSLDPRWHSIREDGTPLPGPERPLQITLRTGAPVSDVVTGVFNPAREEYRWLLTNSQPILDSDGRVESAVATFVDITERRHTQALMEASLKEKEVLLKEVHHRVKNNLQIISTLLDLKASGLSDPAAVGAFRDSQHRVRAMALIHEKLYRSENLSQVDFRTYLSDLLEHLSGSFGVPGEALVLEGEAEGLSLSLDSAVPVGLLLNELVCNSLKHAFPHGATGNVRVRFRRLASGERELTVVDDGVGMGEDLDLEKAGTLGLQLVWTLVRQLGGSIERLPGTGTAFRILFREPAERQVAVG